MTTKEKKCRICEKDNIKLTKHHLIPRVISKRINPDNDMAKTTINICGNCHKQIHMHLLEHLFSEKRFNPINKMDILKFHLLKVFLKEKYVNVYISFRKHWKKYLRNELEELEKDERELGSLLKEDK